MATATLTQNVANSPTNSYPVSVFKQTNGGELQAVVLTDSTGAEYNAASSFGIGTYDYISLVYTGANLTSVIYKVGGSGGTTIATLTLAYTGSNLTSVTKT